MKKYYIQSILVLLILSLAACNPTTTGQIGLDKEFEEYRAEVLEPLNDRAIKTAEMGGRYTTMLEETEEAFHYINEELISYASETRDIAVDAQDGLVNPEIQELNEILIENLELTLKSFTMTAAMTEMNIPPIEDEKAVYEKTENIYAELMELQEEIDRTSAEFDKRVEQLAAN
jgi:predicted small secreted protein